MTKTFLNSSVLEKVGVFSIYAIFLYVLEKIFLYLKCRCVRIFLCLLSGDVFLLQKTAW